jgi:STE24 endopeptidase
LAIAATAATAEVAVALLRPRSGVIEPVPVSAGSFFSQAELERARRFVRPQLALFGARRLVEAGALATLVRRARARRLVEAGALATLVRRGSQWPAGHGRRRSVQAAVLAGAVTSLALDTATLPIAAVARRRSIRVGLSTDSWRSWALDRAKAGGIGGVFAGAAAGAAVGLMQLTGATWWLPASALTVGVAAGLTYLAPLVLDPLFNTFTVLPEGPARDDVLELARGAGVSVGEVFTVDASRRTTAANAYVTGIGATKRVVLFDTLLEHFSRDEIRLVIAHELAHVRHRDVARGALLGLLVTPVGLFAVARLTEQLAPGMAGRRPMPAVVPALALASSIVAAPVAVISHRLSRRVEARADTFALQLTDAPEAWISFERRIAIRNVADPDPPAWIRVVLGTHPSALERIGVAKAYEQAARSSGRPTLTASRDD